MLSKAESVSGGLALARGPLRGAGPSASSINGADMTVVANLRSPGDIRVEGSGRG